jgi:MFS family permease
MVLYFVNYLDRVNIAFAGPNGMNHDLGLSATVFGFASGIFFIGYLFLEVPSNLILHRVGARRWVSRIMLTWGVVATAMAFVPNPATLIVLRFLLGVAESGFFPGIILYLSFWFPAERQAQAVSWFMVALPVSTAVGSVVSGLVISHGDGLLGLAGWRFMFLVEGLPAILLAAVTWLLLSDDPRTVRWLTPVERSWLVTKLEREAARSADERRWTVRRSLTHPRILVLCLVDFGLTYGLYALGFFLPTIISGFEGQFGTHFTIVQRGMVTAVPYAFGALAMLLWARRSDRTRKRHLHIAIPMTVGGVIIPIALYLQNPWWSLAAITVCAMGVCAALPAFWALPSEQLVGMAAASGLAVLSSIGNSAGFFAPYVTGILADVTGSQRAGLWVTGCAMLAGAAIVMILRYRAGAEDTLRTP